MTNRATEMDMTMVVMVVFATAYTVFLHPGAIVDEMQESFFGKKSKGSEDGRLVGSFQGVNHILEREGSFDLIIYNFEHQQPYGRHTDALP